MSDLLKSIKTKKSKIDFFQHRSEKGFGKTLLFGALAGFVTTICLICLFAAIMLLLNIDRIYASFFATMSVSAGAFVSAFYVSKRVNMKGMISGLLTGLCYFVIIETVSLSVDGSGFTSNTVFHLIIILLSAAIGGITGANRKQGSGSIKL